MVTGIFVTHGKLATALIETARVIYGEFSNCHGVTNEGKSPQALKEEIDSLVDGASDGPSIVFVDFFGGSCCHACLQLKVEREGVPVIAGVNLPMLLAFLNKRDVVPFEQLPAEILGRGHSSIQSVDPSKM
jgi:PTS system mannose-specific IIA component